MSSRHGRGQGPTETKHRVDGKPLCIWGDAAPSEFPPMPYGMLPENMDDVRWLFGGGVQALADSDAEAFRRQFECDLEASSDCCLTYERDDWGYFGPLLAGSWYGQKSDHHFRLAYANRRVAEDKGVAEVLARKIG